GHPGCWWSLTPPFHPYPARCARGGLFSVALSRGSPRVALSNHPALWSPDFPRRRWTRRRGRPASSSATSSLPRGRSVPAVRHVDDEPGAVDDEHPERQPGPHADAERRAALEAARVDDGAQRVVAAHVGDLVARGGRGLDGRLARVVVGGVVDAHLQPGPAGHRDHVAGAVLAHLVDVLDAVAGGGAVEVEHDAVEAVVPAGADGRERGAAQ